VTLPLRDLQRAFAAGVIGDDHALLAHLRGGRFSGERQYRVYRHNTAANLTDALAAVYPVVKRLVGEGFFDYAADRYWRDHPPASGNIHDFGGRLPDFLAGFEPAASLPYLPDVARLEWAWHRAFHSPDAPPLDRTRLAGIAPTDYSTLRFRPHPSAQLIESRWPVLRIWEAHQRPGEPETLDLDDGGECLLVLRRGLSVFVERLSAGEHAFLASLAGQRPLAVACEAALAAEPAFDIPARLSHAVAQHWLVDIDFTPTTLPGEPS
jgi:hypothetical protein